MELEIKKISSDDDILDNFDCTNPSINKLIKKSYYPTLLRQGYTFCVSCQGITIAYYMLNFMYFDIESFPDDISDYYDASFGNGLCSVHIKYIAVDKQYQKQKVATNILQHIMDSTKTLSNGWPVRFITLDALTDKVKLYRKLGFKELEPEDIHSPTVTMYYDCTPSDEIESIESYELNP